MDSKIEELTSKLLQEGVEKGKAEAAKIIEQAQEEAARIIAEAKTEAEDITTRAQKDAQSLDQNTKSELKMYTAQAMNALKSEIANVVCGEIVKTSVKDLTADKAFMNEFVLKLAEKWGAQEDIVISTADAASLKDLFARKAKNLLDKSVKIEQVNGHSTDFTISPADNSYKINFGTAEFEDYFKTFLRPQLVKMLF